MLHHRLLRIIVPVLAAIVLTVWVHPQATFAAFSQQGASIVPKNSTDFSSASFNQSLDRLAAVHANYVTLIIPLYQSNMWSTDIYKGWNTPTDDSLRSAVQQAHARGLRVQFKIHMETNDGNWRAAINPGDRNSWFTNYGNFVRAYASLGQELGVEQYCIGAELINMSTYTSLHTNTDNWRALISSVRARYSGSLTYSANWGGDWFANEKDHIGFWDALDYVGVSAYFPLNQGGSHSVQAFTDAWATIDRDQIAPLAASTGKPILFTEVGYRSVNDANNDPFDYSRGGWSDQQIQADLYRALTNYWKSSNHMIGVHLWDWESDPNAGGQGTTSFTPQNKQAEAVISAAFSGDSMNPAPPPPSSGPVSITGMVTATSPAQIGVPVPLKIEVKNVGAAVSNALIDLEVYKDGSRVFQDVVEGQLINSNGTVHRTVSWTPSMVGTYIVKLGVFSSGWTQLYTWNNDAATVVVQSTAVPPSPNPTPNPAPSPSPQLPPSASSAVEIWWPSNGNSVSGVQPFKAILKDAAVDSYKMYWQVDGGQKNEMGNSNEGYPHKLSWVNLDPWNWSGSGKYTLTFIATSPQGIELARKDTNITVTH